MRKQLQLPFLFGIFLLLRILFIISFPPFTDESLYVRWGTLMTNIPAYRWASITQLSRQPLAFWIYGVGAGLVPNPVIGARLTLLALATPVFFLIHFTIKRLSDDKTALIASAIHALTPFFILTETLALMDGFLWIITNTILWILICNKQKNQILNWVFIGVLIGIGLWIKTTFIIAIPFIFILIVLQKTNNHHFPKSLPVQIAVILSCAFIVLSPLIIRPDIAYLWKEPGSFSFGIKELFEFPIIYWLKNLSTTGAAAIFYLNPVFVIAFLFITRSVWKQSIKTLFLLWIVPILIFIILGKNYRIRYFAPFTMPLLLVLAIGLKTMWGKMRLSWLPYLSWVITIGYTLLFITKPPFIFSFFPTFSGERDYALSWPSGYGLPETIKWIDDRLKAGNMLFIAVADSPGNPSDYLLTVYAHNPRVQIIYVTLSDLTEFSKIQAVADKVPLLLVTRSSLIKPEIRRFLDPLTIFNKPYNDDAIEINRIIF